MKKNLKKILKKEKVQVKYFYFFYWFKKNKVHYTLAFSTGGGGGGFQTLASGTEPEISILEPIEN